MKRKKNEEILLEEGTSNIRGDGVFVPPDSQLMNGRDYICETCGKSYKTKGSLQQHLKYGCSNGHQFKCPYCPYTTNYKFNLKPHIGRKHLKDLV
ncbi:hypothetical protein LSTR_LSTR000985 [Laodelphax striatellus]|uniref:C2H2-type domain-containing protein n=1 Tax=Laodelphax striatellus TaxID=195883 RepID=A0A482X0X2_LAOST|nr:hypothetical protein LSTR_LSTR000985 [Laodelphax striatellus]